MKTAELEKLLIVGVKIKIGKKCAEETGMDEGEIMELIEGNFEYDNGLYTSIQYCPSIFDCGEFMSIYHLFENDLSNFLDCEIIIDAEPTQIAQNI